MAVEIYGNIHSIVFGNVIHKMLNTKCRAAVKLWPKCFGLRRCLTATYRKKQPIKKVKIIVQLTIYLTQNTIHRQKLVRELPNNITAISYLYEDTGNCSTQ